MVNGLTDIVSTVSVPKSEYEDLIRESETLDILKKLFKDNKYVSDTTIRSILHVEYIEKGEENNGSPE